MIRFFCLGCLFLLALAACGETFSGFGSDAGGGVGVGGAGGAGGGVSTAGNGPGGSGGGEGGATSSCPRGSSEVPAIPNGWSGPVLVAVAAAADGFPACDAGAERVGGSGITSDPSTCPCKCGDPAASSCSATLEFHPTVSSGCSGTADKVLVLTEGMCTPLSPDANGANLNWTPTAAAAGACAASAGEPTHPLADWAEHAASCDADLFDNDGALCAKAPPPKWGEALCVLQAGDHSCPGDFPDARTYYKDIEDTRDCADDCGCDPSTVDCEGTIGLYQVLGCNTGVIAGMPPNTCTPSTHVAALYDASPSGTCTPSAATPVGGLSPIEPVTVCCTEP